jgi:exosortase
MFCWVLLVYCYHCPMIRREHRSPSLVALTGLLLLVCYAATLGGMIQQWSTDEDMGHGFLVPVVISWIVWRERGRWRELDTKPSLWGFALLAAGAGLHAAGAMGAGLFASSLGLLLSVAGVVLGFGGFPLVRAWIFPLLLTLFMLPKLAIVYNQATLPLQLLASRLAAGILTISGLGVIREGNILDVGGHRVAVAEACNGIRFLLPLGFLAVVFAYLSDPKAWMRLAVLAAAIPVAIGANAVRVAAAAWSPALDSGLPHEAEGGVIFVLSLAMIPILQRLFNFVYARALAQRREYA